MNILPSRRPAVIALHAGIGSAQEWRPLAERLRFAYRVRAPDLYGYAADTPLSLDAEAALIEPLLDAFPGPAYLVGHDYGAAVALKLAHRRRERVAGLVLYEPAAFGLLLADPGSGYAALDIAVLRRVLGRYVESGDWFRAALRYVDHWLGADAWERLSTPQRATIASRMPELWARLDAALSDLTPLAGYARIDVPVRLLTDVRTHAATVRIARLLAGALPRAEWRRIEGADRMGPGSHPEAVDREVRRATAGELAPRSGADARVRAAGIPVPGSRTKGAEAAGRNRGRSGGRWYWPIHPRVI